MEGGRAGEDGRLLSAIAQSLDLWNRCCEEFDLSLQQAEAKPVSFNNDVPRLSLLAPNHFIYTQRGGRERNVHPRVRVFDVELMRSVF